MADPTEQDPSLIPHEYFPETLVIIEQLRENPTIPFTCAHGDEEGAVGIYEVPSGCIALPGVQTQPLCQHHRWSDGSFEGMIPIVDLTINGAWSGRFGDEFDYYIASNPETGELYLATAAEFEQRFE